LSLTIFGIFFKVLGIMRSFHFFKGSTTIHKIYSYLSKIKTH